MGNGWSRGVGLQLCRVRISRDLMCNMVALVNNTVLSTGDLLRVDFRCFHHREKGEWVKL